VKLVRKADSFISESASIGQGDCFRMASQPSRAMDLLADISLTLPKVATGDYDPSDDYIGHRSV
jgi:hypothetical protein